METDPPRVIGIGASAGGLEAVGTLLAGLPASLPAAVLVVIHQSDAGPGRLAELLDRRCALPVRAASDGDVPAAGLVQVAVPGHHLVLEKGTLRVTRGPRENGHRPAVDPLFRSLALETGPGAVGVVLSGMLDDGAAGLLEIVRHGGAAAVQDPDEAAFPAMPAASLRQVPGAVVRPVAELAGAMQALLARPALGVVRRSERLAEEVGVALGHRTPASEPSHLPAGLSCPDCGGPLYETDEATLMRYRCRIGHAWSQESLRAGQTAAAEKALETALRALEEKAALHHRIARSADDRGSSRLAGRARQTAHDALASAAVVRDLLSNPGDGEAR
ncbi:chemotaxis protein CheB [Actinomycetospora soli]|uniref:chemotaxis protein CheB n=1 Tax=Actinomycetospora soli TaxID=2893887 RepID=UPI001E2DF634|nr:chemotaxis protein CheB [Actinomycetospora soli]MCD2186918.1 chemotaxis protein CheB [Actinomycetospora soli]